jgi:hypothetical protein
MTEAPRVGDPLEHVADERDAAEQAVAEPATHPIVAEDGQAMHAAGHGARPGVNDAAGATDDAIARRAYELYQARGFMDGSDVEDWLQAERELRAGDGPADEPDNPSHLSHRPTD